MIEKSSKRRLSIITDIIIFFIILAVTFPIFNHFYKSQNDVNDGKDILVQDNLISGERNEKNVEAENKMYIKNIKEEYGIKVRYGKDIEEFAKNVNATPQYDVYILNNNLRIIYKALEKYPSSVFDMSKNKKYPITIFIVNEFSNNNLALAARSSLNDFRLYISNTQKFERAFHHEMYHLLEYYMEDTKRYLYASWDELNPADFEYETDISKLTDEYVYKEVSNSLVNENSLKDEEDTKNYVVNDSNIIANFDTSLNPYFVTKYSKVTEKEDRAEIFAEMMILNKMPKYLYKEQNIRKKAEVMINTIRINITSEEFFYSKFFK